MLTSKLPNQSSIMTVITRAALKASKKLIRDFAELEHLQVSVKSNKTFVTNADLMADKVLKEELLYARPDYSVISEESEEIVGKNSSLVWIIDPLDGTTNYMHGLPHWAVSIALEKDNEIVSAVTYDPIKNEMFWAEKGCSAHVNDKKIRVSGRKSVADLLIAVNSFDINVPSYMRTTNASMRCSGSATLDMAYLAAGRTDILFNLHEHTNKWDTAAGMLLIKEAGGVCFTRDGKPTDSYLEVAIMCNIDLIDIAMEIYKDISK